MRAREQEIENNNIEDFAETANRQHSLIRVLDPELRLCAVQITLSVISVIKAILWYLFLLLYINF